MAQNLDQLKQKYQSAINAMGQYQVHLQNVNMQGDKLFIRAEAPSEDAKNKIWDLIKQADPSYSDLTADITVNPSLAPAAATQSGGASSGGGASQNSRSYMVKPGDTLSAISRQFYGDANDYMKIFNANKDKMSDPNHIQAGTEIVIPA